MFATRNVSPIDSREHARRRKTSIFDVQLPPRIVISAGSSIFSNKSLAFSLHLWSHAPPSTPAWSPNRIPNTFSTAPFRFTSLQPSRKNPLPFFENYTAWQTQTAFKEPHVEIHDSQAETQQQWILFFTHHTLYPLRSGTTLPNTCL